VPFAQAHERAGLLSTVYVVSYLSMGLPAVIAGFLVVHGGGVLATADEYGVAVMVLTVLAAPGLRRPRSARARAALATVVSVKAAPVTRAHAVPVRTGSATTEDAAPAMCVTARTS
jgi:hypothetical protein